MVFSIRKENGNYGHILGVFFIEDEERIPRGRDQGPPSGQPTRAEGERKLRIRAVRKPPVCLL